MIIRTFKDRLDEYDMLAKRLVLSFRGQDDEQIVREIQGLKETGLSLRYIKIDLLFHYFNCCGNSKNPDFLVFALLVQNGAVISAEARGLFRKLFLHHKEKFEISDDVIQIAKRIAEPDRA